MALFKINKGDSSRLESQKAHEGYAYFTPDNGKFYIDVAGDGSQDAILGENRIALSAEKAEQDLLGNVIDETYIRINVDGAEAGSATKINADLLNGLSADEYATKAYVDNFMNGTGAGVDLSTAQKGDWDGNTLATDLPMGLTYSQGGIDKGFPSNYITCFSIKYNNDRCM